jgi:hypothetical protein
LNLFKAGGAGALSSGPGAAAVASTDEPSAIATLR